VWSVECGALTQVGSRLTRKFRPGWKDLPGINTSLLHTFVKYNHKFLLHWDPQNRKFRVTVAVMYSTMVGSALLENKRTAWRGFPAANALAYLTIKLVMKKNKFYNLDHNHWSPEDADSVVGSYWIDQHLAPGSCQPLLLLQPLRSNSQNCSNIKLLWPLHEGNVTRVGIDCPVSSLEGWSLY